MSSGIFVDVKKDGIGVRKDAVGKKLVPRSTATSRARAQRGHTPTTLLTPNSCEKSPNVVKQATLNKSRSQRDPVTAPEVPSNKCKITAIPRLRKSNSSLQQQDLQILSVQRPQSAPRSPSLHRKDVNKAETIDLEWEMQLLPNSQDEGDVAMQIENQEEDNADDICQDLIKNLIQEPDEELVCQHERPQPVSPGPWRDCIPESMVFSLPHPATEELPGDDIEDALRSAANLQCSLRKAWVDQSMLENQNAELMKELAATKHELEETKEQLANSTEESETQMQTGNHLDSRLRAAKCRIDVLQRRLVDNETALADANSGVKVLEQQIRNKTATADGRFRRLREASVARENAAANQMKEMSDRVSELEKSVESWRRCEDAASKRAREAERERDELAARLAALGREADVVNANMASMEDDRSTRELELSVSLQSARNSQRLAEEEVLALKNEKVKFLDTLAKIAESDDKSSTQQKMAAELLAKEEAIARMQLEVRDLAKRCSASEQKLSVSEEQVRHLLRQSAEVPGDEELRVAHRDLQQEVISLRYNIMEAVNHNQELAEIIVQKDMAMDQQSKAVKSHCKVVKVREELINELKHKEEVQRREQESMLHELENKDRIIEEMRVESLTLMESGEARCTELATSRAHCQALDAALQRSSRQRTRLEERLAELERRRAGEGGTPPQSRRFFFF